MKVITAIGKQPAIQAQDKRTTIVRDAHGRNTPAWLPAVQGRPEGPRAIAVNVVGHRDEPAYLSREEAMELADSLIDTIALFDRHSTE